MTSGDLGVRSRRRAANQLIIGVALLVGVILTVAKLPPWLVERGRRLAFACLNSTSERHADPSGCSLGPGFAIGGWFPHAKPMAREARERFRTRMVTETFDYVIANRPDAARRDAAAKAVIEHEADREAGVIDAAVTGAFSALATIDLGTLPIGRRHQPAFAAIAIGDVATARKAIASGVASDSDGAARTGALACLLGERDRGLALLRDADAMARLGSTGLDSEARFAAQHCGGTFETVGFEPYAVVSFHQLDAALSRAYDPAFQAGRRTAFGLTAREDTSIYRAGVVGSFALAAGGEADLSVATLIEIITERGGHEVDVDAPFAATPWMVVTTDDPSTFIDYVPPAWLEAAAARYERAIPTVKKPLTSAVHDQLTVVEQTSLLRRAAVFAYLHAAGYRIRRGDRDGARTDLGKARALDATTLWRAPLELAAGDPTSALATLDAWQAQNKEADPDLLGVAIVNRVLALAATGEYAKAYELAAAVRTRERDWLMLATAIASNSPLPARPTAASTDDSYRLTCDAMRVAIETKRLPDEHDSFDEDDLAVLPAVAFVVAHAAQVAGADPEVVLDRVFAGVMPSRAVALARAEAARWRNDQATAKAWDARAAVIEKLFVDDHAAVLGGIAGLW